MYGTTWQFDPVNLKLDNYISILCQSWVMYSNEYGDHLIADASTGRCYYGTPLSVAIDYPKKHTLRKGFLTTPKHPKTCGIEIISSQNFPQEVQGRYFVEHLCGVSGHPPPSSESRWQRIYCQRTSPLASVQRPELPTRRPQIWSGWRLVRLGLVQPHRPAWRARISGSIEGPCPWQGFGESPAVANRPLP